MAPLAERGVTGLAPKGLDRFSVTMLAIPKEAHEPEHL